MNRIRSSQGGVIWSYAGTAVRLLINVALLPLFLFFLSDDKLGLWYVFVSLSGIVLLLQLGFSPALARNIAYCMSGVKELAKEGASRATSQISWPLLSNVILVSKKFYGIISFVALCLLLTLGSAYVMSLADLNRHYLFAVWGSYSLGIFLNIYFSYFESALRGVGAIAEVNKSSVYSVFIQVLICASLFCLGFGLLSPVFAYVAQGVSYRMFCRRYFWRNESIRTGLDKKSMKKMADPAMQKHLYKMMAPNAYRDGIVLLANYLATQANTIVASMFLPLADTGFYSLTIQLINAIASLSAVVVSAYHPVLQSSFATGDNVEIRRLISLSSSAFVVSFAVGFLLLAVFGIPIMQMLKPSYEVPFLFLLMTGFYYFIWKQQTNYAAYISNNNTIPYAIPFVLASLGGVALSILLTGGFGIGAYGLIGGQLVAQIVFNSWYWVRYVDKRIGATYLGSLLLGLKEWRRVLLKRLR